MSSIETFLVRKGVGMLAKSFTTNVIQRWSNYRALSFLEQFVQLVENENITGIESKDLDQKLKKILEGEVSSELLFESYRKVCLSASKDLGPKIIALLTAKLIFEERHASNEEESFFRLAENLNDGELIDVSIFPDEIKKKKIVETYDNYTIFELNCESYDSNSQNQVFLSNISLVDEFGHWANRLESFGLIKQEFMQDVPEKYEEDSERYIDEPGQIQKYYNYLYVQSELDDFVDLINRAKGPIDD